MRRAVSSGTAARRSELKKDTRTAIRVNVEFELEDGSREVTVRGMSDRVEVALDTLRKLVDPDGEIYGVNGKDMLGRCPENTRLPTTAKEEDEEIVIGADDDRHVLAGKYAAPETGEMIPAVLQTMKVGGVPMLCTLRASQYELMGLNEPRRDNDARARALCRKEEPLPACALAAKRKVEQAKARAKVDAERAAKRAEREARKAGKTATASGGAYPDAAAL